MVASNPNFQHSFDILNAVFKNWIIFLITIIQRVLYVGCNRKILWSNILSIGFVLRSKNVCVWYNVLQCLENLRLVIWTPKYCRQRDRLMDRGTDRIYLWIDVCHRIISIAISSTFRRYLHPTKLINIPLWGTYYKIQKYCCLSSVIDRNRNLVSNINL